MTTSAAPRHAWHPVIDLEDTVTFTVPGEATQRLTGPIPRDSERRHAFAAVDPATTGSLPALAGLAAELARRADAADLARIAAERRTGAPGRHRAERPSLLARLFGRGRRGGV